MTQPSQYKVNLQYFAEGDPVNPIEPTDPPNPDEPTDTEPPAEPEFSLDIQYNKEQIKLDKEKAIELAQKGMNYDKAVERAKQESLDEYIASQNYEHNGNKITTKAEYDQAMRELEIRKQYEGKVDEEVLNEIVESKKFREQYETESQQQREQSEVEAENKAQYKAFIDAYPDVKDTDIPQSVWDDFNTGTNLVDAYTRHENKSLKQKLAELEEGKQIDSQNAANAQSSTGSIKNDGGGQTAYYTREQVAKMSNAETNKNWSAITQSMKKWE